MLGLRPGHQTGAAELADQLGQTFPLLLPCPEAEVGAHHHLLQSCPRQATVSVDEGTTDLPPPRLAVGPPCGESLGSW